MIKSFFCHGAQKFLGIAELDSDSFQLSNEDKEKVGHNNDYFKTDYGVYLTNITKWDKPKKVIDFRESLSFVKEKEKYFSYFQGGIRKISKEDYTIISGIESSNYLEWKDKPLPKPSSDQITSKEIIDVTITKLSNELGSIKKCEGKDYLGEYYLINNKILIHIDYSSSGWHGIWTKSKFERLREKHKDRFFIIFVMGNSDTIFTIPSLEIARIFKDSPTAKAGDWKADIERRTGNEYYIIPTDTKPENITEYLNNFDLIRRYLETNEIESSNYLEWKDKPLPKPSSDQVTKAIDMIREKLMIDESIIRHIITTLISGKHILLAGPIGTGKTHLAKLISQYVWQDFDGGYYSEVYTATSVWTTQEVIGGIYPKLQKIGNEEKIIYDIQKGCVTDTVSKNWRDNDSRPMRIKYTDTKGNSYRGVWLVIDEFNRANIDSAFGEMLTAFEHGNLKIPTNRKGINFEELPIPQDYRIIGTLNTFDKHYLFKLSDALKRRFAYIEINPPYAENKEDGKKIEEEEKYYILKRSLEGLEYIEDLKDKVALDENHSLNRPKTDPAILYLLDSAYEIFRFIRYTKNLGTAILISIFRFILVDSMFIDYSKSIFELDSSLDKAFTSNIIPQLEGKSKWSLEVIHSFCCDQITEFFKKRNRQQTDFRHYATEFLKLLKFLYINEPEKKVERYRKNEIQQEKEWDNYNPWLIKKKPNLPLFKKSLSELIEESEIL